MLAVRSAREGVSSDGLVQSGFEEWVGEQVAADRLSEFLDLPSEEPFLPDPLPDEG